MSTKSIVRLGYIFNNIVFLTQVKVPVERRLKTEDWPLKKWCFSPKTPQFIALFMRVCENQEGAYTLSRECVHTLKRVCTHPQESTLKRVCTHPQENVYSPSQFLTHSQVSLYPPSRECVIILKHFHTLFQECVKKKNTHEFVKIINLKIVINIAWKNNWKILGYETWEMRNQSLSRWITYNVELNMCLFSLKGEN